MSDDFSPKLVKKSELKAELKRYYAEEKAKKNIMFIPVFTINSFLRGIIKSNNRYEIKGLQDIRRFFDLEYAFQKAVDLLMVRKRMSAIYSVPLNWKEILKSHLCLKTISSVKNSREEKDKRKKINSSL